MLQNLRKRNEGFTIIEVLIVLAIAGLIMLVVFLAVPALQRNARNNDRKNDVSRVGAAVSDWVANNDGAVFSAGADNANITTVLNQAGTLRQYVAGDVSHDTGAGDGADINDLEIVTAAKCGTNGATVAGTTRQMAIRYAVENASGSTSVCLNI